MNPHDSTLADFQACLLDILHRHENADAIFAALAAHPSVTPFRDYVDTFEPEMLEVAASLVKKWGVRRESQAVGDLSAMPH